MRPEMIYVDHSATTRVDDRVLDAMLPFFKEQFGNPSTLYFLGQQARQAIESARRRVAQRLNANPREIIFTGSGTESDNLALRGVALARRHEGKHLITTAIEHKAVLDTVRHLERDHGFDLTILPVDAYGMVSVESVERALRPDTVLVSVMYANNEVGTIQPIADIGHLLRSHAASFHVDAVQAGGYLPLDVASLGVDLLSLSGHKFHAPKGVGLLYLRRGTPYINLMTGGSQEGNQRAGTHNVPYIVGLARALEIAQEGREEKNAHLKEMRDLAMTSILEEIPAAALTGHPTMRLPGHLSLTLGANLAADGILAGLDMEGIAASSGSACTSGLNEPSHVLLAMGITEDNAMSALRLTFGDDNTIDEARRVAEVVPIIVERMKAFA